MVNLSDPPDCATMPDGELLRQFVETNSPKIFSAIVHRHTDWIYSTALRVVRDRQLAEDVTQAVFVLLARKGRKLSAKVQLTGWLFLTTRNIARHALRAEIRRRKYEKAAADMNPTESSPSDQDESLEQLRPHIDEAVGRLSSEDQQALLLRFYSQRSLAQVGAELGISEEAARKRISRAIDKLRARLTRKGLTLPAIALPELMEKLTHQAPPTLATRSAMLALAQPSAQVTALIALAAGPKSLVISIVGLATAAVIGLVVTLANVDRKPDTIPPQPAPAAAQLTFVTTRPSSIKVGWIVSQYLANSPGFFGHGRQGYKAHVTAIRPRFLDLEIELYALVEPDSLDNTEQQQILLQNFEPDHTLLVTDPHALEKMDVIVASRNWYMREDVAQCVTAAVKSGKGLLIHCPRSESIYRLFDLPGMPFDHFWTRQPVPCQVVSDHPLLFGLKEILPEGKLDIANLSGVLSPRAVTPLIVALGDDGDRKDLPANIKKRDFYPMYITQLGKGSVVGCQWDSVPHSLIEASKGRFYIRCCQFLAHRPLD